MYEECNDEKDAKETNSEDTNCCKGKQKGKLVFNMVIEDLFDAKEFRCAILLLDNSFTLHGQDMQIIKCGIIDASMDQT